MTVLDELKKAETILERNLAKAEREKAVSLINSFLSLCSSKISLDTKYRYYDDIYNYYYRWSSYLRKIYKEVPESHICLHEAMEISRIDYSAELQHFDEILSKYKHFILDVFSKKSYQAHFGELIHEFYDEDNLRDYSFEIYMALRSAPHSQTPPLFRNATSYSYIDEETYILKDMFRAKGGTPISEEQWEFEGVKNEA